MIACNQVLFHAATAVTAPQSSQDPRPGPSICHRRAIGALSEYTARVTFPNAGPADGSAVLYPLFAPLFGPIPVVGKSKD
jgi:hypothetical protein